jgi:hypothetical protein
LPLPRPAPCPLGQLVPVPVLPAIPGRQSGDQPDLSLRRGQTQNETVKQARRDNIRGKVEARDGHALLTRLKVAAALAILEGRHTVDDEDWHLSGIVMAVSDATWGRCMRAVPLPVAGAPLLDHGVYDRWSLLDLGDAGQPVGHGDQVTGQVWSGWSKCRSRPGQVVTSAGQRLTSPCASIGQSAGQSPGHTVTRLVRATGQVDQRGDQGRSARHGHSSVPAVMQ